MRQGFGNFILVVLILSLCDVGFSKGPPYAEFLKLNSHKEKMLLVNFWSPFCEPCGEEVGQLNEILRKANEGHLSLAVVGVPVQGRQQEIDEFVKHFKPEYEQRVSLKRQQLGEILELSQVPQTLLFDKDRNLIKRWTGKVSTDDILQFLSAKME